MMNTPDFEGDNPRLVRAHIILLKFAYNPIRFPSNVGFPSCSVVLIVCLICSTNFSGCVACSRIWTAGSWLRLRPTLDAGAVRVGGGGYSCRDCVAPCP